jgi:hypothetical protein
MELLWILLAFAAFPLSILGGRLLVRAFPDDSELPRIIDTGPGEPCWTEEIGRDERFVYTRSECVDDALMELDDRARRGAFPFYQGGA